MSVPTTTETSEFRFGLGHPVLEFVATLARRRDEPRERLETAGDLSRWLELSRFATRARCNQRLLEEARQLREAVYEMLDAARHNRRPPRSALVLINRWAKQPGRAPQLDTSLQISWIGPDPARAALARLAAAAVELVAGPELARVRNCADPTCSLMFIDRSRPGRRRWCSMDRCGNRAKTAHYRRQHNQQHRGRRRTAVSGVIGNTRIRRAVATDLAGIREIVERAYGPYVQRVGRRPAPMDDDYARKLRSAEVFVAEADDRIRGVIVLLEHDDHLFVENVAVDPEYQGAGIGRALLAYAERFAADHDLPELRLYTNALMTENLAYYPRLGYREVARRREAGFNRVFFAKLLG